SSSVKKKPKFRWLSTFPRTCVPFGRPLTARSHSSSVGVLGHGPASSAFSGHTPAASCPSRARLASHNLAWMIAPARFTLALDPEELGERRATAAIVGAPLELTMSWREGAAGGPNAIRRMSDSLETHSPILEADLEDVTVVDHG